MKIRVWYMPDGQVRHTVFKEGTDINKCIEKIFERHPELQNVDYEDINREDMPDHKWVVDPAVVDRQRETWKRKAGGDIEVDQQKVKQIKDEKLIAEEMAKIDLTEKRQKAIDNLKAKGEIK